MMLLCLLGDKRVAKSLSPLMHNAVLARHGLEGQYVAIPVEPMDLEATVARLRDEGLAGANVTVPHKEAVAPLLDSLSSQARTMGAVNTIVRRGLELVGHNTDVEGFSAALAHPAFRAQGCRALVLGAGGAARAVVMALLGLGVDEVLVASRTMDRCRRLAEDLGARPVGLEQAHLHAAMAELVVNATSASSPAESPQLADLAGRLRLNRCQLLVDVNYGRQENFWKEAAVKAGAPFVDGLVMLAHQARLSFKLWTGVDAPVEEFTAALETRP
jgi:shikimate dehydrogenase